MRSTLLVSFLASLLLVGASCSFVLDKSTVQCRQDSDCAQFETGATCREGLCVEPPILVGQSAPATGASQALGLEMNRGLQLAFDLVNADGGVNGRKVKLDFLDDQYEPPLAEANARTLVDVQTTTDAPKCPTTTTPPVAGQMAFSSTALKAGPKAVLAIIGAVGTPTMVRAAPIAVETGRLYFGAFTGAATMLRNTQAGPCAKYIFNMRASYGQEALATLQYFLAVRVPNDTHLISFDQNDSFGQAGYDGLVAAYQQVKGMAPNIARYRYTRNDVTSVPLQINNTVNYLTNLLAQSPGNHVVGVMMTDTYGPGAAYIKGLRDWQFDTARQSVTLDGGAGLDAGMDDGGMSLDGGAPNVVAINQAQRLTLYFSNVSFVGPDALAAELKRLGTFMTPSGPVPYTDKVYVSQVVPNYATDQNDVVKEYRALMQGIGAQPTFTSLEGFLAGKLFVEGLRRAKSPITPDSMITAFETLPPMNLALGASAGFSATNHQYSQSVWGTGIEPNGTFSNTYFFSNNTLQLFQ